jgi:hypothetical protein
MNRIQTADYGTPVRKPAPDAAAQELEPGGRRYEKTVAVYHRTRNGERELGPPQRHEILVQLVDTPGNGAWEPAGLRWLTERPPDAYLAGRLEEYALERTRAEAGGRLKKRA